MARYFPKVHPVKAKKPAQDPVKAEKKRKAEERFAARAKIGRDASAAEWREEVARHELRETRRRKRIAARGLTAADVREVVGLAENMTGGIGPRGVALHATVTLIGAELVRRVREGNFDQGFALALAEVNRKFDQPTIVAEVMRDAGLDLAELRAAGVDKYDLDEIAKCLPSEQAKNMAKHMSRVTGHNIIAKKVE